MPRRMQSPSSINLYKQCPRKYYYQYILRLPTKPSIHLIRGSIVHEVLEKFFTIDIETLDEQDYAFGLRSFATGQLLKLWKKNKERLMKLGMHQKDLEHYLLDSQDMLNNFVSQFTKKLKAKIEELRSAKEAFKALTPAIEEEITSHELQVKGFIDAIHDHDDIVIIDYKTSKKDDLTPAYRLQLSIYALLYKLKYGELPKKVGINFLKFGEKTIDVDEALVEEAKREVKLVHELTESTNIKDYPVNITPLCKWSTGQCDFYDVCIKER